MSDKAKSTNYKREFNAQNYDRIELTVKKGKKEKLKTHAAQRGETVNGFINRAINETVERDEREQGQRHTDTRQAETAPVLPEKPEGQEGAGAGSQGKRTTALGTANSGGVPLPKRVPFPRPKGSGEEKREMSIEELTAFSNATREKHKADREGKK